MRLQTACHLINLSALTVQRWQGPLATAGDSRTASLCAEVSPPNKLSAAEREAAMQVLNSAEFKDLPPSQIVPRLADAGQHVASESTLYRLLRQAGQLTHRGLTRVPRKISRPRALVATQPDQIYCWDINRAGALVQQRSPPQRHSLRHAHATPCQPG